MGVAVTVLGLCDLVYASDKVCGRGLGICGRGLSVGFAVVVCNGGREVRKCHAPWGNGCKDRVVLL